MKNFLRAAASFILFVLATCVWAADTWTSIEKDFNRAKTHEDAVANIGKASDYPEEPLHSLLLNFEQAKTSKAKDEEFLQIKQYLSSLALSEQYSNATGADVTVKSIKSNKLYTSQKEATSANWIQKLLDRLKHLFDQKSTGSNNPQSKPPEWVLPLIQGLFILVCVGIVILIVYLLTKIPWSFTAAGRARRLKNRGGMLDEGETLLSEDEYLVEADRLIAEGKYREACRALYLASLLRIDKTRIARFEPAQTNWEHLRRIETSALRPERLHFRPVTKAFDLAWYGYRVKSADDVVIFRDTYLLIKSLTEAMP